MRGVSMCKRKRSPRLAAIAVAALGAAGGTALAATSDSAGPPTQTTVPMAQSISPAQAGNYGVLRGSAVGGLPDSVRPFPADAVRSYGPNPALAHVTYPNGDRSDPWYIVPGHGSLCFYEVKQSEGSCTSLSNAAAGKFMVWTARMGSDGPPDTTGASQKVVGIVPDDVTSVRVTTESGDAPAQLDGNVVQATADGITGLKLETASGETMSVASP
jgi:hypothetical protein